MMKNPSCDGGMLQTAAERMCPMAIKFNQGETYHTLKTMGVMQKSDGRSQISQRIGKDGPDIETDEDLTFVERKDGRLWFTRADGSTVCGHPSHFDADHAYNTAVAGAPTDLQTKIEKARSRVERSEEQLKAATEKLAAYLQAAQTAEDGGQAMGDGASAGEEDDGIDFTSPSPEARDEARELFAQG